MNKPVSKTKSYVLIALIILLSVTSVYMATLYMAAGSSPQPEFGSIWVQIMFFIYLAAIFPGYSLMQAFEPLFQIGDLEFAIGAGVISILFWSGLLHGTIVVVRRYLINYVKRLLQYFRSRTGR